MLQLSCFSQSSPSVTFTRALRPAPPTSSTPTSTPTASPTPTATSTPTPTPACSANYTFTVGSGSIVSGTTDIGNHCDGSTEHMAVPHPPTFLINHLTSDNTITYVNLKYL